MFRWSHVLVLVSVGALAALACGHDDDVGKKPEPSGGTGAHGGSSGKGGSSGRGGSSGAGSTALGGSAGNSSNGGDGGDAPTGAGQGGGGESGVNQGGAGNSGLGGGGVSNEEACADAAEALEGKACVASALFSCGSQCCCGECYPNWQCRCDDGEWYCEIVDVSCDDQCPGAGGAGGDSG
jgi:hypothetical protein